MRHVLVSIAVGARVGPYEITSLLGAGGMGEVYRAKDTRLARDVAVKILPEEFFEDEERRTRFEREARTLASLNHPGVAAIYSFEEIPGSPAAPGRHLLVMELLEGESLRARLDDGALPARKAVELAIQIANGLAAAHEKGIVHRDLKPENVFLTKEGRAKILDFGLAKLTRPEPVADLTSAPTTPPATTAGVVLGTVGYMSPEQVRGEKVDARSDVFSFGAILYEMLSGNRAFKGASAVETMHAILKDDPPELSGGPSAVPPVLDRVVRRCLEKRADERFQSARDIAFALEALSGTSASTPLALPLAKKSPRAWMPTAVALAILVAASGLFAGRRLARAPLPTFRRLTFRRGSLPTARFAPDGRTVIYSAAWSGGKKQLYSTRTESPESLPLPHGEADVFAISSSGEMALNIDGNLAQVPLSGGGAREVLQGVSGADWSPDGKSLAIVHSVGERRRLEYPIGNVLYETPGLIGSARVSPRGDLVAFVDSPVNWDDRGCIAVVDLKGAKRTLTTEWQGFGSLAWSPRGDEIWFTGARGRDTWGEIHAVDLSGRDRVVTRSAASAGIMDIDRGGRVLLMTASCWTNLFVLPPGETKERDLSWFEHSSWPHLSPDGKIVVFTETGEGSDSVLYTTYVRKTDGSAAVRLGEGRGGKLSPDGRWVLSGLPTVPARLRLLPVGAGSPRALDSGPVERIGYPGLLVPGDRIFFWGQEVGHGPRIYLQDIAVGAEGKPRPISPEGFYCFNAATPDGRFIMATDPKKRLCLYPVEGGEPRLVPGAVEGRPITVSADGRSVFVVEGDIPKRIFRVDLASGKKELVKEIMSPDPVGLEGVQSVDITPDGKSYAYTCARCQNDLYLVEGFR